MMMIGYKQFNMKWANRCSDCGKNLLVGSIGWGLKDDLNNKWVFLCDNCYRGTNDPNVKGNVKSNWTGDSVKKGGDISDLLDIVESAEGDSMADAVVGTLSGKTKPTDLSSIPKPAKRPPTILELIKWNALYGGV